MGIDSIATSLDDPALATIREGAVRIRRHSAGRGSCRPGFLASVADLLESLAGDYFTSMEDPECPNCGEGCGGHEVQLLHDECSLPPAECPCPGGLAYRIARMWLGEDDA